MNNNKLPDAPESNDSDVPRTPEVIESLTGGRRAEASDLLQDGRNMSDVGLEHFPEDIREIAFHIRRMSHAEAAKLTLACKGLLTVYEMLSDGSHEHLRAALVALGKNVGTLAAYKHDIQRLLRSERPRDGYNVRESVPEQPQTFSARNTLSVTVKLPKEQHTFTIRPAQRGDASEVQTPVGTVRLGTTGTVTLGRDNLVMKEVFGRKLLNNQRISIPNDLKLANDAPNVPRAAFRIVRNGDRIAIFECGATNVTEIEVEELATANNQAPKVVSRTRLNTNSGKSIVDVNIKDLFGGGMA